MAKCNQFIVTVYPAQKATPYQNDQILRKFLMWEGEVIIDPKVNIAYLYNGNILLAVRWCQYGEMLLNLNYNILT